jgi:type IV secretory pathway VirB6-like protein
MKIIANILNDTETILADYVKTSFDAVSGPLQATLAVAGGLSLIFVALNHLYNVKQVSYATYISWAIRYACIVAFATVWGNFEFAKNAIVNTPIEFAATTVLVTQTKKTVKYECGFITGPFGAVKFAKKYCFKEEIVSSSGPSNVSTINSALDQYTDKIMTVARELFEKVGLKPATWKFIFSGFVVMIVGLMFALISLITLLIAKIGISLMLALGPIAISMLTFPQTRGYFERWLSMTVGFALVPMLVIGLMGLMLKVAGNVNNSPDHFFGGNGAFIIISIGAILFLLQVPTLASTLANAGLPNVGMAAVKAAASTAMLGASAPLRAAASLSSGLASRSSNAVADGRAASARGGGPMGVAFSAAKAMTQSSNHRATEARRKEVNASNLSNAQAKGNQRKQANFGANTAGAGMGAARSAAQNTAHSGQSASTMNGNKSNNNTPK